MLIPYNTDAPLMHELIDRFPERSVRVRLRLAQAYLQNTSEPGRAIKVLDAIPAGALNADLEKIRVGLKSKALNALKGS